MDQLLSNLQRDFTNLTFIPGDIFAWSPKQRHITYKPDSQPLSLWSLLHEVGHAELQHTSYTLDIQLLIMEAAAWDKASQIGQTYGYKIDNDHIQDCLDTYRDWLHQRSRCPSCGLICLQTNARTYRCYNCQTQWQVTGDQLCRPYRRKKLEAI